MTFIMRMNFTIPEQADDAFIGYDPIGGGGITNQKIALIGLLLQACERGYPVVLPRLRVMDQLTRAHRPFDFADVFELSPMLAFCHRHGIAVRQREPHELPQGYDEFFWKTYHVVHDMPTNPNAWQSAFVLDLLRSLQPCIRAAFLTQALRKTFWAIDPGTIVAQIRLEEDWKLHCEKNLKGNVPADEENYLELAVILEKDRK